MACGYGPAGDPLAPQKARDSSCQPRRCAPRHTLHRFPSSRERRHGGLATASSPRSAFAGAVGTGHAHSEPRTAPAIGHRRSHRSGNAGTLPVLDAFFADREDDTPDRPLAFLSSISTASKSQRLLRYPAGDELLTQLGARLQGALRNSDCSSGSRRRVRRRPHRRRCRLRRLRRQRSRQFENLSSSTW